MAVYLGSCNICHVEFLFLLYDLYFHVYLCGISLFWYFSVQKSLDSIYHSINMFNSFRVSHSFGYNSVKAAVDDCGRAAGLADDQILSGHKRPPVSFDFLCCISIELLYHINNTQSQIFRIFFYFV